MNGLRPSAQSRIYDDAKSTRDDAETIPDNENPRAELPRGGAVEMEARVSFADSRE